MYGCACAWWRVFGLCVCVTMCVSVVARLLCFCCMVFVGCLCVCVLGWFRVGCVCLMFLVVVLLVCWVMVVFLCLGRRFRWIGGVTNAPQAGEEGDGAGGCRGESGAAGEVVDGDVVGAAGGAMAGDPLRRVAIELREEPGRGLARVVSGERERCGFIAERGHLRPRISSPNKPGNSVTS